MGIFVFFTSVFFLIWISIFPIIKKKCSNFVGIFFLFSIPFLSISIPSLGLILPLIFGKQLFHSHFPYLVLGWWIAPWIIVGSVFILIIIRIFDFLIKKIRF